MSSARGADLAVRFDGVNDFITFGQAAGLGASNFTLEVWFLRQGAGVTTSTGSGGITAVPLLTKGRAEADNSNVDMNYFLGIGTTNVLVADFELFAGGTNKPVIGVTPILNGVWYHAAITYDSSNWVVYLNGSIETNLNIGAGSIPRYDSIQHAGLATAMSSSGTAAGFFNGTLDEARIWNYARTQQEIRDALRTAITNTPTGLLGRWGLDAGSGTIATNSVDPLLSGILSNGPTYVSGYPFALAGTGGMFFDGVDDYVTFGPTNALGLATFTLEAWIKRTGTGIVTTTGTGGLLAIPLVSKGRGEAEGSNVDMNYFMGITTNNGALCADFEQTGGGTNWPVVGNTSITTGVWHHVAATYDGANWSLYLDGVLETNQFVGQTPRFDSIQHAGLGRAMTSAGTPAGAFNGVMDEVRIWNYARNTAQILNNKDAVILAADGLVARWSLDQEFGNIASNSGPSLVHGVLSNGAVWVAGNVLATNVILSVGVTNVTPSCGSTTGGTAITITGSNFVDGATVSVGGNAAGSVVVLNASEITAVTPAGAAGNAVVSVTNTNGESGTLNVGFSYLGAPSPSNDGPVCGGQTLNLFANTNATSYSWTGPNGFSSTNENPSIPAATTAAGGTYSLVFALGGCESATGTTVVAVNTLPTMTTTPSESVTICLGNSVTITAAGAATYTWSPATGLDTTNGDTVVASPTSTTIYTVAGTDSNGCQNATNVTVDVIGLPAAPAITTPADGFCITAGSVGAFTVAGTAETNGPVRIFAGATLLAAMSADGSGNWSTNLDFTGESDGSVSLTAVATNICFFGSSPAVSGTKDLLAPGFAGLSTVTAGVESATLAWPAAVDTGSVTYAVFQATTSGGQNFGAPVLTTNSLSALVAPLYPGSNSPITYFFVVRATDVCGNAESNIVELSVQPLLNPNSDQDGDGMPNGFEEAYGLDPFDAADAGLDSDGDGMTNLQEAVAGTNPTDSGSVLRITAIERAGEDVIVSWLTGAGRTNALQSTAGGDGGSYETNGFADLFTVTNATGGITNYPDVGAATNVPARYYRIRLVP